MTSTDERAVAPAARRRQRAGRADRWLVTGLTALAVALAVNSLLGPLAAGVVTYPFSESLANQIVGLEAVSLLVVAPWCVVAAHLVRRGDRAGPVLALAPPAYAAYMFAQYVVGPGYRVYAPAVLFHLGIFVLAGLVLARAWTLVRVESLPEPTTRRERVSAAALFLLAAFVVLRYLPAFVGSLTRTPLSAEYAADPAMFWSIFLLDLGVVVPVAVVTGVGLLRDADWARTALYGVAGWFTLVPISVAAMGLAMVLDGDPNASVASVAALSVAALLFTAFAVWVHRPLLGRRSPRADGGTGGTRWPPALVLYVVVAVVLSVTALYGGGALLLDPTGSSMRMPVEWLAGTPFPDYFVPGAVLFVVLGVGPVLVVAGILRRSRWAWAAAVGLGVVLVGWIGVQMLLLRTVNALQVAYGCLGLLLVLLALRPPVRDALRQ